MSETFETLHNLVHKGVKVVMDIPYELWNETSAEVADLKKQVPSCWGQCAAAVRAGKGSAGVGMGSGLCHVLVPGCPLPVSVMCWWRSMKT